MHDFWPDHVVRCRCGADARYAVAITDGWTSVETLPIDGSREPKELTGVCGTCSSVADAAAVLQMTRKA